MATSLLREFIRETLAEAKIKARKGADPDSDETETWIGDDRRVLRALARAGVSGIEREHIMAGSIPVSSSVLSMLKRTAGLKRDPSERKPVSSSPRRIKDPYRSRRAAENKFQAAVKKFAKNWTHFTQESPDVSPEDAAPDAAEGFFYEYPEWQAWSRAMDMPKDVMKSAIADYVYDAMMSRR